MLKLFVFLLFLTPSLTAPIEYETNVPENRNTRAPGSPCCAKCDVRTSQDKYYPKDRSRSSGGGCCKHQHLPICEEVDEEEQERRKEEAESFSEQLNTFTRLTAKQITNMKDTEKTNSDFNNLAINLKNIEINICGDESLNLQQFSEFIFIFHRRFKDSDEVVPIIEILSDTNNHDSLVEFTISSNLTSLMNYVTTVKYKMRVDTINWLIEHIKMEGGCVELGDMDTDYIYSLGDTEIETTSGYDFMRDTYEKFLFIQSDRNAEYRLSRSFEGHIDIMATYKVGVYNKTEFIKFLNKFLLKYKVRPEMVEHNDEQTYYQMIVEEQDHVVFKCLKFVEYFGETPAIDLWNFQIEATLRKNFWEIDRIFMTPPKYLWEYKMVERSRQEYFDELRKQITAKFVSEVANEFEDVPKPKANCTQTTYTNKQMKSFYENLFANFVNYTKPIKINCEFSDLENNDFALFQFGIYHDNNGTSQRIDVMSNSSYNIKFDTYQLEEFELNCPELWSGNTTVQWEFAL